MGVTRGKRGCRGSRRKEKRMLRGRAVKRESYGGEGGSVAAVTPRYEAVLSGESSEH